jgi:hypothetical protein
LTGVKASLTSPTIFGSAPLSTEMLVRAWILGGPHEIQKRNRMQHHGRIRALWQ